MQVFITRPRLESEELAQELRHLGYTPVCAPLLEIERVSTTDGSSIPNLTRDVQALALTSANGARAAKGFGLPRDLPVFAVGDATANAARRSGFAHVTSARGDAKAVAQMIRGALSPDAGTILHLSGEAVAGDLKEALEASGFTYRRHIAYRAKPVSELPPALVTALHDGTSDPAIKAIMIFSPRTAETFVRLYNKAGANIGCTSLVAICLSEAVAQPLEAMGLNRLHIARAPNRAAMLDALAEARRVAECAP
jgi:uroporphyrinogen-III synthase